MIFSMVGTLILSILLTLAMIKLAVKLSIVDRPDSFLKPHAKVTPYMGGVAVFFSVIFFYITDIRFVIPSIILLILGLYDDIKSLNPKIRILVEFSTISFYVVLYSSETNPLWLMLLVLTGVALINSVNMIDGMDGVCTGTVLIALACLYFLTGDRRILFFIAALSGFLIFNFNPAKIFLGDAGSYFLGFSLFFYLIQLFRQSHFEGYIKGIIVCGLLFTDLFFAVLRRIINGKSPFSGDRDHLYDKLSRRRGVSVKLSSLIMYVFALIFGVIGSVSWNNLFFGVIISLIVFLYIGIKYKLYTYK
ncbi:MAG TPA: MraY family glycosyltransferase [Petrotogaceae bacterium]|nr:MraY family glycosyltransferase [Petrotogaceae bacterium]